MCIYWRTLNGYCGRNEEQKYYRDSFSFLLSEILMQGDEIRVRRYSTINNYATFSPFFFYENDVIYHCDFPAFTPEVVHSSPPEYLSLYMKRRCIRNHDSAARESSRQSAAADSVESAIATCQLGRQMFHPLSALVWRRNI